MIDFLTYGGYDYSYRTPPLSWFARHSRALYTHWGPFSKSVRKEIWLCWMAGTSGFIPMVPFQVVPSTAITEPRQPSKFRTIWNASILVPRMTKSAVENGANLEVTVSSNPNAIVPQYLVMVWLSIESV